MCLGVESGRGVLNVRVAVVTHAFHLARSGFRTAPGGGRGDFERRSDRRVTTAARLYHEGYTGTIFLVSDAGSLEYGLNFLNGRVFCWVM